MKRNITSIAILLGVILLSSFIKKEQSSYKIYSEIEMYIKTSIKDFENITPERKEQLKEVSLFIKTKLSAEKKANLVFICTHNSRRSHLSQIWAQTAAEYYGVKDVSCFSGGTEATAFNPRAVKALTKAGFVITKITEDKNPIYEVKFADDVKALNAFSKKYTEEPNPKNNFCAIMTCSQADKVCPMIEGATSRVAIPYEDPKEFDGTDKEEAQYGERCRQIATEMLYIFSLCSK